jgi:hypothetical protein
MPGCSIFSKLLSFYPVGIKIFLNMEREMYQFVSQWFVAFGSITTVIGFFIKIALR